MRGVAGRRRRAQVRVGCGGRPAQDRRRGRRRRNGRPSQRGVADARIPRTRRTPLATGGLASRWPSA
ncbi:MAG: hypothetical protein DMF83_20260 [Acidobacteria bacterium]|nr:MAG: hypothetical protein DMF83_20260 [Acidobacteriota bacterium]